MKKFYIFALVFIMTLALLTACGGKKDPDQDGSNDPATTEGSDISPDGTDAEEENQVADTLVNWMREGKFSFDYTATNEFAGKKDESSGSMAIDGDKIAMTMEMIIEGQPAKSRLIVNNDKTYIIDDEAKMIISVGGIGAEMTAGRLTDYSAIGFVGSGSGEIDGKTLRFVEYEDRTTGSIIKYYLEDGQVYGYESEYDGYKTVTIVTNPKNSVPSGVFDLPTGYDQMSM